jgi:hypothetical protein
LLHAVVPVGEPEDALLLQRFQDRLAVRRCLEGVHRLDIVEQEGQVENTELLGDGLELGKRGRRHLYGLALYQFDKDGGVVEQLATWIDLDPDLAFHAFVDALRILLGGQVLGVVLASGNVAELDDDFLGGGGGRHQQGRGNGTHHTEFH